MFEYPLQSNLVASISDHSPILLQTEGEEVRLTPRRFKFENKWCREVELKEVMMTGWDKDNGTDVIGKLQNCAKELEDWGRRISRPMRGEIKRCNQQLLELRDKSDDQSIQVMKDVKKRMSELLVREEEH